MYIYTFLASVMNVVYLLRHTTDQHRKIKAWFRLNTNVKRKCIYVTSFVRAVIWSSFLFFKLKFLPINWHTKHKQKRNITTRTTRWNDNRKQQQQHEFMQWTHTFSINIIVNEQETQIYRMPNVWYDLFETVMKLHFCLRHSNIKSILSYKYTQTPFHHILDTRLWAS